MKKIVIILLLFYGCNKNKEIGNISLASLEKSGNLPILDRSEDLGGPDRDKNGVRDDIDRYVESLSLNREEKNALLQSSKALRGTTLINITNKNELFQAAHKVNQSVSCMFSQFKDDPDEYSDRLDAMTLNTKKRFKAYMKYNSALSGTSTRLLEGDQCEN